MTEEQLAFDIEGMIHEAAVAAAPKWTGAPLHFTTKYHSPAELDAAFEHWHFLHAHDKTHINSRMWHRSSGTTTRCPDGASCPSSRRGKASWTRTARRRPRRGGSPSTTRRRLQVPGAPIITERRPFGTRHVPGRSPWGGYDLSHTAVDPDRVVEGARPLRRRHDFSLKPARSVPVSGVGLGD